MLPRVSVTVNVWPTGVPTRITTARKFPAELAVASASEAFTPVASTPLRCTSEITVVAPVTVHANVRLLESEPSDTAAVTVYVPVVLESVPEMSPVELFTFNPGGSPLAL